MRERGSDAAANKLNDSTVCATNKNFMTALEQFGSWVASGRGADESVHPTLALHFVVAVAAWIAGRSTAEGASLERLPDAVARHCACARLSEIDDIHLASATTPGGVIVPAALTLAAERGADGAA